MQIIMFIEIPSAIYFIASSDCYKKSRECHKYKLQPFPDTKRKRKQTKTKQAQIQQTFKKH